MAVVYRFALLAIGVLVFGLCGVPAQAQQASFGNMQLRKGGYTLPDNKPLPLKENKGQWNDWIRYQASIPGGRLYAGPNSLKFLFYDQQAVAGLHNLKRKQELPAKPWIDGHVVNLVFAGANPAPTIQPENALYSHEHYMLGNDPSRWAKYVTSYGGLWYRQLYPGADLHLYTHENRLKYDLHLAPGASPAALRVQYQGATAVLVRKGRLAIQTTMGDMTETLPYAYQVVGGKKVLVACEYRQLDDSTVTYHFPDGLNPEAETVIDPTLIFSTYTGATADNWGFTATPGPDGTLFSGGLIFDIFTGAQSFPVTAGAVQIGYGGDVRGGAFNVRYALTYGSDMAIIKYSADGTQILYATYLGGSDNEQPHSMIASAGGELYVFGTTRSPNFPTSTGAWDRTLSRVRPYNNTVQGDIDIVVVGLNASGTAFAGSTYVGGDQPDGVNMSDGVQNTARGTYNNPLYYFYADDARGEIVFGRDSSILVATCTRSADFPITTDAHQTTLSGSQDAAIFNMDRQLTQLRWSTLLGGGAYDAAYSLKHGANDKIYVAGATSSSDFPNLGNGLMNSYQGGRADGFVAVFDENTKTLERTSYYGTNQHDHISIIETDRLNNIYIVGNSNGALTAQNVLWSTPERGQFITRLNEQINTVQFQTVFGTRGLTTYRDGTARPDEADISISALLVDQCDNIYISGWGGREATTSIPTTVAGLPTIPATDSRFRQTTDPDGSDFYLLVLYPNADSVYFASFFGGSESADHVDGGTSRFDKRGAVYQSMCGSCGGFLNDIPTTPNAASNTNNSDNCNNASFKIQFDILDLADATFNFDVSSTAGCAPFTVDFTNTSMNADDYHWDFGDGQTSDVVNPVHIYPDPGIYPVVLKAGRQNNLCYAEDSVKHQIYVYAVSQPGFTATPELCAPTVRFTNTTLNGTTYRWFFDGTNTSDEFEPTYTFPAPGTYPVRLLINPGTLCEREITQDVTVFGDAASAFTFSQDACSPTVVFTNTSANANTWRWDFGTGDISTAENPSYNFPSEGNYTVKLVVSRDGNCLDSTTQVLSIPPPPVASFSYDPLACTRNRQFTNTSGPASSFFWQTSDGQTSTLENPEFIWAQAGTYQVSFTRDAGTSCEVTVTEDVVVLLQPTAAFAPLGDICVLDVPFDNTTQDGTTWLWDFGDGSTSTAQNPTHTYAAPGTYDVVLTANPGTQCPATASQVVQRFGESIASFTTDRQTCLRQFFFNNTSQGAAGWLWRFGDGDSSTAQHPTHLYSGTGPFMVLLITNPGTICADTATQVVRPPYLADAGFTAQSQECQSQVVFTNTSTGGTHFLWDFGNGTTSTDEHPTVNYVRTGTYEVTLVVNPDSTCPAILTQTFFFRPPSLSSAQSPNPGCNATLQFANRSANGDTWLWNFGDGQTSVEAAPLHTFPGPGTYMVTLTADPGGPCPHTDTIVVALPRHAEAAFTTEGERCGYTYTFTAIPDSATTSYQWVVASQPQGATGQLTWTAPGDGVFEVMLIANPDSACPDTARLDLFAGSEAVSAALDVPDRWCTLEVPVLNQSQNAETWLWEWGDGSTDTVQLPGSHTYPAAGTYTITLTVDRGTACEHVVQSSVTIADPIIPDYSIYQVACEGYLAVDNRTQGATGFLWDFGNGKTSTEASPQIVYTEGGQYRVRLTIYGPDGCTFSTDTLATYYPGLVGALEIPNVFTPNGDGLNDIFKVLGPGRGCVEEVLIFNRWGQQLYHTRDTSLGWDGNYNGEHSPEGVYVYVLRGYGKEHVGTVTLLR